MIETEAGWRFGQIGSGCRSTTRGPRGRSRRRVGRGWATTNADRWEPAPGVRSIRRRRGWVVDLHEPDPGAMTTIARRFGRDAEALSLHLLKVRRGRRSAVGRRSRRRGAAPRPWPTPTTLPPTARRHRSAGVAPPWPWTSGGRATLGASLACAGTATDALDRRRGIGDRWHADVAARSDARLDVGVGPFSHRIDGHQPFVRVVWWRRMNRA